jgi:hypothetical protein
VAKETTLHDRTIPAPNGRWKACNTVNLSCHVGPVTLDLEELDLVDIEGVRFLDMESKNGS